MSIDSTEFTHLYDSSELVLLEVLRMEQLRGRLACIVADGSGGASLLVGRLLPLSFLCVH